MQAEDGVYGFVMARVNLIVVCVVGWPRPRLPFYWPSCGQECVTWRRSGVHQACAFSPNQRCWKSIPAELEIELVAVCWLRKGGRFPAAVFGPPH